MPEPFPVTIFHNPGCGTSRNVLALLEAHGYAPTVIEYLKVGWDRSELEALMARAGVAPRAWLREKGSPAAELGLIADGVSDVALIEAMIAHPALVNRPIVVTPKGVRLCRPSEVVVELLRERPETFTKEDGEVVRFDAPAAAGQDRPG